MMISKGMLVIYKSHNEKGERDGLQSRKKKSSED